MGAQPASLRAQSRPRVSWVPLLPVGLAVFLLAGRFTQIVALLLSLQLFGIAVTIGYNDVGVRDFALGLATVSLFLQGPDKWTLDRRSKG